MPLQAWQSRAGENGRMDREGKRENSWHGGRATNKRVRARMDGDAAPTDGNGRRGRRWSNNEREIESISLNDVKKNSFRALRSPQRSKTIRGASNFTYTSNCMGILYRHGRRHLIVRTAKMFRQNRTRLLIASCPIHIISLLQKLADTSCPCWQTHIWKYLK